MWASLRGAALRMCCECVGDALRVRAGGAAGSRCGGVASPGLRRGGLTPLDRQRARNGAGVERLMRCPATRDAPAARGAQPQRPSR